MGISRTVTFDMTTFATSNAYSSRFLTPVHAMAIALALIAAHRERDVRSADIKSQIPRTYFTRRLRAFKDQDNGVGLYFVLTPTHFYALNGSPPTTEPNQGDMLCGSPARCQGYAGAILPAEGCDLYWA
ncbi:hypothetical protein PoB_003191700 [Plakobranchus ocellatus]|uniref:Uncharacterized protein n=1 Tax=Plakobranchus ocellatus TaxID=259542 RepID=A0AAV4AEV1_9GAST|nr:hypothetical protein PoB_003191700 [Plakobranchus ocellatus]